MYTLNNLRSKKEIKTLEQIALGGVRLFQPFRMENAFFVDALVCVGAEVVALGLDKVRWQCFHPIAVVVG